MKPIERIIITFILCLTLLAAVWLHGILNRYEVAMQNSSNSANHPIRYDRITGRAWLLFNDGRYIELGLSPMWQENK
jgi:hypothetical protein